MTMNRTTPPFTFSGRVRSMQYAFTGIRDLLATQHNAWIHAIATMLVFCAAWVLDVAAIQWCVLILAVSAVWVAEGLNTAFELICDVVCPESHPLVKRAKDIAAGAVLLSALGAVGVGLVIFLPLVARLL